MHDLHYTADGTVEDIKIGYVGGGSRSWATTLMNDLAQAGDISGEVALYDVDHESAARNAELGEWIQGHDEAVGDWTYEAVRDLEDALEGADFVILSTQDPPGETMAHDLDLPKEYGIHQSVGDTVGPGGTLRAMRAIPQYREIAAAIREQCPDAWVINYTNPMTVCTRTLYEEFPEINAVGLCHEVFKAQGLFADLVEEHLGAEDVEREDISVNVKGINHFTWVDEAYYRGEDVYHLIEEWAAEKPDVPRFEPGDLDEESFFVDHDDVTLDLYERFDMLPAAGDRHLAEFVPWYLDPIEEDAQAQRWGIRMTPAEYRVNHWPDGETERGRQLESDEPFDFYESGEEAVDWMRALLGLEPLKTHANVPNAGQVPNLPEGAVVETNVMVTGDEVKPVNAGPLPSQVRTMVLPHVHNQETLIEASRTGDVDLAYRAFLNDALVTIDAAEARELFSRLVATEREYLEAWDLEGADVLLETAEPAAPVVADD
ncbi:MAG: glycoside hydrolase family 4 [Halobacteriales archaeon]